MANFKKSLNVFNLKIFVLIILMGIPIRLFADADTNNFVPLPGTPCDSLIGGDPSTKDGQMYPPTNLKNRLSLTLGTGQSLEYDSVRKQYYCHIYNYYSQWALQNNLLGVTPKNPTNSVVFKNEITGWSPTPLKTYYCDYNTDGTPKAPNAYPSQQSPTLVSPTGNVLCPASVGTDSVQFVPYGDNLFGAMPFVTLQTTSNSSCPQFAATGSNGYTALTQIYKDAGSLVSGASYQFFTPTTIPLTPVTIWNTNCLNNTTSSGRTANVSVGSGAQVLMPTWGPNSSGVANVTNSNGVVVAGPQCMSQSFTEGANAKWGWNDRNLSGVIGSPITDIACVPAGTPQPVGPTPINVTATSTVGNQMTVYWQLAPADMTNAGYFEIDVTSGNPPVVTTFEVPNSANGGLPAQVACPANGYPAYSQCFTYNITSNIYSGYYNVSVSASFASNSQTITNLGAPGTATSQVFVLDGSAPGSGGAGSSGDTTSGGSSTGHPNFSSMTLDKNLLTPVNVNATLAIDTTNTVNVSWGLTTSYTADMTGFVVAYSPTTGPNTGIVTPIFLPTNTITSTVLSNIHPGTYYFMVYTYGNNTLSEPASILLTVPEVVKPPINITAVIRQLGAAKMAVITWNMSNIDLQTLNTWTSYNFIISPLQQSSTQPSPQPITLPNLKPIRSDEPGYSTQYATFVVQRLAAEIMPNVAGTYTLQVTLTNSSNPAMNVVGTPLSPGSNVVTYSP